ncbi:tryptophan halogenase family protein [Asticcacaulis biprosthecium]|uniref:tryptophan halogenase family protein n=1 Tax=Asticcacaulis biprosthecium TaxID=76891 RepID=UPI000300A193|nr:tryptophan halogenase family protein [Asticcacaulis biprosthecium]
MDAQIRNIVIVGGGTSGWMTAAGLSRVLGTQNYTITLVESEEIGTVGVGEATIPMIRMYNDLLGFDEDEFVRQTNASFKLGIEFVNWRRVGHTYFHPFGTIGVDTDGVPFTHFWQRLLALGGSDDYTRFNLESQAARQGLMGRLTDGNPIKLNYAFHFDAALYAGFLRRYSEARGVVRKEGKIVKVNQDPQGGHLTSVALEDGRLIAGDLFIDCSGFRGLLIEQTLKAGYEDWSAWLPCNRAAAVPTERARLADGSDAPTTPFTRSTAQEAGWQWRIPLQHRTGNGYVFCNEYVSEDEAIGKLLGRLDGKPLKDPKILRFVTGHRRKMWDKNVIALGLASGFLEPLESTSIHLVQVGLAKLLTYFPKRGITPAIARRYNDEMLAEYVNVKDFLIAHYHVTERDDTPFWRYCKNMSIPDSLKSRLDLFAATGQAAVLPTELFKEQSWFSVLVGQGVLPRDYHPVADAVSEDEVRLRGSRMQAAIQARIKPLVSHDAFIARHCAAAAM